MSQISNEDLDLQHYEGIRRQLASTIMKGGKVPEDKESQDLLLKVIDGGSRTALTRKRIEVEKEGNQINAEKQAIVQELLRSVPTLKQAKSRTQELPSVEMVVPKPGEIDIGTKELPYEKIMSTENQNPH